MTTHSELLPAEPLHALQLAQQIRDGKLSSLEATQQCIARIQKVDPHINSVVIPLFDLALKDAARLDAMAVEGNTPVPYMVFRSRSKSVFMLPIPTVVWESMA